MDLINGLVMDAKRNIKNITPSVRSMRAYFERDFVSIEHDKRNATVFMKWKAEPTSDEFRQGLNTLLFAMQHFKTGKVIVDTIYLGTIAADDLEWSTTTWTNLAVRAGYSHHATIISTDNFAKLPAEEKLCKEVGILLFALFDSREAATHWITAKEHDLIGG